MSSADRDRPRRGGPGGRPRRRGQGWDGQVWNGQGWFGEPGGRPQQHGWGGDWHGRGWSGEWRAAAWNTDRPDDASDNAGREARWDDAGRADASGAQTPERPRSDVKRVRIGDAERDRAVSMLSEHFVAGRLTQAEFEERSEVVTQARYADDLEPLFDDLPASTELQVAQPPAALRRRTGPPPPFLMLVPFLMIGLVVTSVALTAPWLLWGMFWIILISGMSRRRHYR
ncbi:DUF1707 domain-containing protein [Kribbella sp. NPDC050459]|uniref:DUF1707 SHOCT-like domain-containing protein n=1 Tax=Kribbella sp. NPDC050459 TaxID=3155785 RepID=UPI003402F6A4